MAVDIWPVGTAQSADGAGIDIPVQDAPFAGAFLVVDMVFFSSLPGSMEVVAAGVNLEPMGLWSREPDIAIQRWGAVLPNGVTDAIHVNIATPADPFACVAFAINADDFQRNAATPVGDPVQSSGIDNPVELTPQWTTPPGTNIVTLATLGLVDYTAGVWNGMTDSGNVTDKLYSGHSEQAGSFDIAMNNAAPTSGNAVWLLVVGALAITRGPLTDEVRIRGQDNAWHSITSAAGPGQIRGTDGQWYDLSGADRTDVRIRGPQEWYSLNSAE